MNKFSELIAYYKDCYQSDNRAVSIANFYGAKVENRMLLTTPEMITGQLIQYPIHSAWAEETYKKITLYSKEKELYCCSFFIAGKIKKGETIQKIMAPLFFQSVNIIQEKGVYYIELSEGENNLNPFLFSILKLKNSKHPDPYVYLNEILPKGNIGFDEVHQIEACLKNQF